MKSGSCMVSCHMFAHARNIMVLTLWALRTGNYQAVPI